MEYTDLCNYCRTKNVVDYGDENDLTLPDIGGFTCYKCKKENLCDDAEPHDTIVQGKETLF